MSELEKSMQEPMAPPRTLEGMLSARVSKANAQTYARPIRKTVILLFTPRSGSSWLGDLLSNTGACGFPNEYLNLDLLSETRNSASNETDYLNAIEDECATKNGVFSMKVTWGDIETLETVDFFGRYKDAQFVYLRRRNIVAQAVSAYQAITTGLFHKTERSEIRIPEREHVETMQAIKNACIHIFNYECLAEGQFLSRNICPIRLVYEDIIMEPNRAVEQILKTSGILCSTHPKSTFQRVGSEINLALSNQFLNTESTFVERLNLIRPPVTSSRF